MAAQTWTLFDQSTNEHIGYQEFGKSPSAKFTVHTSGLAAGVEMVDVDNACYQLVASVDGDLYEYDVASSSRRVRSANDELDWWQEIDPIESASSR